jgi:quercetin dioxygenase-like cupin family protein
MTSHVRLTPWNDQAPPPDESAARALLASENLAPYAWGNPPNDRYPPHRHPYHKVLVCLSGSIVFELPELGRSLELRPGDRLDLPPDLLHAARVGPDGVVCLEAHRTRS